LKSEKNKMAKKELNEMREGARKAFLETCHDLAHILHGAHTLPEEEVVPLINETVILLKIFSNKFITKLFSECAEKL